MSIFICGDWHGYPRDYVSRKKFKEGAKMTSRDILFQLGDFGGIWDQKLTAREIENLEYIASCPWTTVVILGNHENYDRIFELPECEFNGARCWYIQTPGMEKPIYFPQAGEILTAEGKKFLCIRGAESYDRYLRIEGQTWWQQERLSRDEIEKILNAAETRDFDYVLSHTCPESVAYQFYDGPPLKCQVSQVLESVFGIITDVDDFASVQKEWYFGHFHNSRETLEFGVKFRCHYLPEQPLKLL